MKKFLINADDIQSIMPGRGGCLATDRIVVDGFPVGYMYREDPVNQEDSGWRFFSGDEDEVYMGDLSKHGVYDVNTIVNYDPTVINYLNLPIGTELERGDDGQMHVIRE